MGISFDRTNVLCGAIFVAFGAFFAIQALGMEIGTAFRMGPGFFPLGLAGILILLGLIIIIQATRVQGEPVGPIAWRGALLILPAPIVFGLTVRGLGFVPAVFITAFGRHSASSAPEGGMPVSRYFQRSIRSLRARATMPIRRWRLLPRPKRV